MSSKRWCIVSGNGYNECPDAFRKAVTRGSKVTGAAWRKGPGATTQSFVIAIEAVLPAQVDEKRAKNHLQKNFLQTYTFGKTLTLCLWFTLEKVCQAGTNFFSYFNRQQFEVIRPTASD